jgi:putative addiction module killer protein
MKNYIKQVIIKVYELPNGNQPFTDWLNSVKDRTIKKRIIDRLDRIRFNNFGDFKSVGDDVCELRLPFGAGYRIYYGQLEDIFILLLCDGDKSTQTRDIEKAKDYFKEYKETN